MKNPDEIKKGLEYCTKPGCSGCPYDDQNLYCGEAKNKDALDYIKQLEIKIAEYEKPLAPLTFEEATADGYYLEIKVEEHVDIALNVFATDTGDDGRVRYITHDYPDLVLRKADYGRTWRCWSRRPTDEERKAAKWYE